MEETAKPIPSAVPSPSSPIDKELSRAKKTLWSIVGGTIKAAELARAVSPKESPGYLLTNFLIILFALSIRLSPLMSFAAIDGLISIKNIMEFPSSVYTCSVLNVTGSAIAIIKRNTPAYKKHKDTKFKRPMSVFCLGFIPFQLIKLSLNSGVKTNPVFFKIKIFISYEKRPTEF